MSKNIRSATPGILSVGAVALGIAVTGFTLNTSVLAQDSDMTFFITSAGPGKGGDLGGLEGADAHCVSLAEAAGSELSNWKAYLSVPAMIDRSGDSPKVLSLIHI